MDEEMDPQRPPGPPAAPKGKERLDVLLVARNLCESRQLARRHILAGEVRVNSDRVDKPGTWVRLDATIALAAQPRFVSRGGDKLAGAIAALGVEPKGRICLDGGISTGGFTDCLLQAGAKTVYGIDVGYGQVAWSLRQDERVILRERTNLRHLTPTDLYGNLPAAEWPDFGVADLSFISLTKVLPALWALLVPPREVLLLVKPQFEVGRDRLGKKGVVREPADRASAIATVLASATALGWHYRGVSLSSMPGPAGNLEYILWLADHSTAEPPTAAEWLAIAQQQPPVAAVRDVKGDVADGLDPDINADTNSE
ncbi:MAG: TlyA family rRNA (cytidine-2'-O)-methyltransferase [Cyanophyceae cyanobacterium]